eukprot:1678028-Rhodomonas_salina.1
MRRGMCTKVGFALGRDGPAEELVLAAHRADAHAKTRQRAPTTPWTGNHATPHMLSKTKHTRKHTPESSRG